MIYFVVFLNLGLISAGDSAVFSALQPSNTTPFKANTSIPLIASLVDNSHEFISQVASLDPKELGKIITLLEKLLTVSDTREQTLSNTLKGKKNANKLAEDNLSDATTNLENAKIGLEVATATFDANTLTQKETKSQQDIAQALYDDEKDSLDEEQRVLRDVINTLKALHKKHKDGSWNTLESALISASSSYSADYLPQNIVLSGSNPWHSGTPNPGVNQWLKFEFSDEVTINGFRTKAHTSWDGSSFKDYRFETFSAGPNWEVIKEGQGINQDCCDFQEIRFPATTGKFFRLFMVNNWGYGWLSLEYMEFSFIGG